MSHESMAHKLTIIELYIVYNWYKTKNRVRPLSKKEINEGAEKCVVAVDKTIAARDTQFTYDYVFPSNVEQIEGRLFFCN